MPLIRRSKLILLLPLLILAGSPLFALAEAGDNIVTSNRLNLRSCPGTSGCAVLRTLPRETNLKVLERQGEWLHVTLQQADETGWVNASYTRVVENSSSGQSSLPIILGSEFLTKLFALLCLVGALVTMAMVGKNFRPQAAGGQLIALSALSVLTGVVIAFNQFGPALAKFSLARLSLSLQGLSVLWDVNAIGEGSISYLKVVLVLVAATVGVAAAAPAVNGGKLSFVQGVCTGFFALPAIAVASFLIALVIWLVLLVLKVIGYLVGLIMIPVGWIVQHVVVPVLQFLAIPFVWLWERFLREIVQFLAIPFVWLWSVILQPVAAFLGRFILRPILALVFGIAITLVVLFPFGAIGMIFLESIENSVRGKLDTLGLFSQGVAAGFLLFDAITLAVLNGLGFLHTAPPLSLAIPVVLQLIILLRLLMRGKMENREEACPVFQQKLASYWASSRLELIATCVLIPFAVLAAFYNEEN